MADIGYIIKRLREKSNMSQAELAHGTCSPKYIYLIEKGERTPSCEILNQLGKQLDVDLFGIYKFIAFEHPITVREVLNDFTKYRRQMNITKLLKLSEKAIKIPDFANVPLIQEIEENKLMYMIFKKKEYKKAEKLLIQNIDLLDKYSVGYQCKMHMKMLLALCYEGLEDMCNACMVIKNVLESLIEKKDLYKKSHLIITAYCAYLFIYSIAGKYADVIDKGFSVYTFQMEFNLHAQIHNTCFLLAFAFKKLGIQKRSDEFLEKAIFFSLTLDQREDIRYMYDRGIISELLAENELGSELVERYRAKYKFN